MKINGLWAHNGLSDKGYAYAEALTENEKRAKAFLGAIVFLILGVSILVNTITGFGKAAWFWNVLPLLIAIIFIGLGFISAKALKENIEDCARFRNERKKAQECGTLYFGEIKGYKVTIEEMQGKGRSGVTYYVSYILEVHLDTGRTKRTDETIEVPQKGVVVGGIYR